MNKEKFIVEINPRTKEKKVIEFLDYEIKKGFTVQNLIEEHELMKEQLKRISKLSKSLVNALAKLNTSTAIQIADIKEEIK